MGGKNPATRIVVAIATAIVTGSMPSVRPALAGEEDGFISLMADDPSYVSLGAGVSGVIPDRKAHDGKAAAFTGEFRPAEPRLFILRPLLGLLGASDGAFYAYGGLRTDIHLGSNFVVMPNAAAGYYRNGQRNLGEHLEFRTGSEFAYQFDDGTRLGVTFNHISNAGLARKNPGEEISTLVVSLPLAFLP
jgi:lipid A 3-O-deacylase